VPATTTSSPSATKAEAAPLARSDATPALVLLLPERRRLGAVPAGGTLARRLGRADRLADGEPGERAQLQRWFELLPRAWPAAAVTRAQDAGDAPLHAWLRADPAFVRPDMTGARVMAIGELGLSADEARALLEPLRPLFGDAGFPISAPHPARWYLALPREARLPAFSPPEVVLGDDLAAHLPEGPEGRRWRALLNEAQILLHNHPVNAARVAAGRLPANSLCFWGFGVLPDRVQAKVARVAGGESLLAALAALAEPAADGELHDLRAERSIVAIGEAVEAAIAQAGAGEVWLDFADGARWALRAGQRWRFWRRPLAALA